MGKHTCNPVTFCDSLHASLFAVSRASVKQVSHSWYIVLDTCAFTTYHCTPSSTCTSTKPHSLYPVVVIDLELVSPFEDLHPDTARSPFLSLLEIHNCAAHCRTPSANGQVQKVQVNRNPTKVQAISLLQVTTKPLKIVFSELAMLKSSANNRMTLMTIQTMRRVR